jgi:hypothetical protein
MVSFARGDWDRADFDFMFSSPVQMYRDDGLVEDSLTWLRAEGYRVIEIDSAEWRSEADLHLAFEQRFSFPAYYGRNLDALHAAATSSCARHPGHLCERIETSPVDWPSDALHRPDR